MQLNFGPAHPAAHGVLRLVLQLDGEVRKPIVQALFHNTDFRKKKLKLKMKKTQNSTNWKKIQENSSKINNSSLKTEQKTHNSRKKLKGLEVMPSSVFQSDVKK